MSMYYILFGKFTYSLLACFLCAFRIMSKCLGKGDEWLDAVSRRLFCPLALSVFNSHLSFGSNCRSFLVLQFIGGLFLLFFDMALEDQYQTTTSTPTYQLSPSIALRPSRRHPKSPRSRRSAGSEPDSSEYTTSSSSIFNATRASSGSEEDGQKLRPNNLPNDKLDSGLAANMAMFVSLEGPFRVNHALWPVHSADEATQKRPRSRTRLQLPPEMHSPSKSDTTPALIFPILDQIPKSDSFDELQPRKTASLNDLGSSARKHSWPGNLVSPVSPIAPKYPPPERTPTPPGLPSFGTQEAVDYAAQFFGRSAANQPNEQHSRSRRAGGRSSDGNRIGSYGGALRRLFGISPSPSSPYNRPPTGVVGRAADGTAVQGRFPYRQSGHGTNMRRRLEDNPFHRRTLPAAVYEPANTDGSPATRHGPSTYVKEDSSVAALNPTPSHPDPRTNSPHHRPMPTPPRCLPSIPQRAVTARPRLTPPTALFSLPQDFSRSSRAALQSHSRLATLTPGDRATPNLGITDGPSDSCLTQPQPPLAEAMQARAGVAKESLGGEGSSCFGAMTRSCFCRPLWDRNVCFSLWRRASISSAERNDSVGGDAPVRSSLDFSTVMPFENRRQPVYGSLNNLADPMVC